MSNTNLFITLDVAIGLVFVFLMVSFIASAVREFFAKVMSLRSKNLEEGIRNLLDDKNATGFAEMIYSHSLVAALGKRDKDKKPSYIPSHTFAMALLDGIRTQVGDQNASGAFDDTASLVAKLPDSQTKRALAALVANAKNDSEAIKADIAQWFDDGMDRVSGWYKRDSQKWMFVIALLVALLLNINAIGVARVLWEEPAIRDVVVGAAQERAGKQDLVQTVKEANNELKKLGLPIGWNLEVVSTIIEDAKNGKPPSDIDSLRVLEHILGWLITALAGSLGAPFWFSALDKLFQIRGAGGKPTRSKDPQAATS